MASRVVPGRSCTTARSSPMRWLKRVDFPTLGLPTKATATIFSEVSSVVSSASSISGRSSITRSSRSPVPRPCNALIVAGSPKPSDTSSHAADSWFRSSTLFATTTTDSALFRNSAATWASSSVIPTVESRTKRITSASDMACSL